MLHPTGYTWNYATKIIMLRPEGISISISYIHVCLLGGNVLLTPAWKHLFMIISPILSVIRNEITQSSYFSISVGIPEIALGLRH